ncbi:MAG TPA: NAD+ synthase [Alphaproteobacteria bacterium]|nr:NAD+ synthase [Alphaproteobacteria bacterium]
MTARLGIALAQLDPLVGDVHGNLERVRKARADAQAMGADLVIFPEMFVSGYPPEDLVLKPSFMQAVEEGVNALVGEIDGGPAVLVGTPWRCDNKTYNAALLLEGGEIAAMRFKHDLPNYGVFDEKRVFAPGPYPGPVPFREARLGVMICEDMWSAGVSECLQESGADMLISLNASPFEIAKLDKRLSFASARVGETHLPLIYVNQIGGQDELVFDGATFVLGADGIRCVQLPSFVEKLSLTRWRRGNSGWRCEDGEYVNVPTGPDSIYRALCRGLRDYVNKNYFPGVLIGLSGGIDSALTAAIAVDALGPARVHCVMMPSPYTSRESIEDAAEAAKLLGVSLETVSITPAMQAFEAMLRESFVGRPPDTTEENIQARARGITLMALSNKLGYMVLSTGNKSEMSVGYATLYGDMCGGFSVLKDVYKTTVYELGRWRNDHIFDWAQGPKRRVIPERIFVKPPTAELKPNQTDLDSLPPYEVLDDILRGLIEGDEGVDEIVARGHDRETITRIWNMLDTAEYKRRQAPPGVKVTGRAFGRERRYPITNAFTIEP